MAGERQRKGGETEVTLEHFPEKWKMTEEEMGLLFYEAEQDRYIADSRYPYHRTAFTEKVRLALKYVSQFWAEPIPQQWLDAQETGKQQQINRLRTALDEAGGDYTQLDHWDQPKSWLRFDAGVVSPVALNLTRALEDYRKSRVEHPRFRAIRFMQEAARVMAAAGDTMAVPQAEYVTFVLKKDEDRDWDSGRQGGAVGDYSLRGAPWALKNGLPVSMDEYDRYSYSHTYADFFPDAPRHDPIEGQQQLI